MRKRKGNGHGLNKVVPLSMAVALLSANTVALAAEDAKFSIADTSATQNGKYGMYEQTLAQVKT